MTHTRTPGCIDPAHLYSRQEVEARLGWGLASFREARRQGLKVSYLGRNLYVMGSDLIEHIVAHGKASRD